MSTRKSSILATSAFKGATLALLLAIPGVHARPAPQTGTTTPSIAYPQTRRDAVVEDHFGQKVADPGDGP